MVYSVVSSEEVDMIMKEIKEVDPKAFVNVIKTEQVNGRFYRRPTTFTGNEPKSMTCGIALRRRKLFILLFEGIAELIQFICRFPFL